MQNEKETYRVSSSLLGPEPWAEIYTQYGSALDAETLQRALGKMGDRGLPAFLPELARLEWTLNEISNRKIDIPGKVESISINPTLQLLNLSWKNLGYLLEAEDQYTLKSPERAEELVIVWRDPVTGEPKVNPASNEDLLVLKIIAEEIDTKTVAEAGHLSVAAIDSAIDRAVRKGMLLSPPSRIKRDTRWFLLTDNIDESFLSSLTFTLQWHITQFCDLHCRHCYDRSPRSHMSLDQAVRILDDLYSFCREMNVKGAVSFTGGNPLLYPQFTDLYREAADRGFSLSILGNPSPRKQMEQLLKIRKPTHFQVSLEGLPDHNDYIRGTGHFSRVMTFLKVLGELGIFSMVMLTLTRDNMGQILPLADILRGSVDRFHFNRLSMVGEGANLLLPDKNDYAAFLESYIDAAEKNPVMGLKDNLINIIRHRKGVKLFGGCTGYGCGAAFNFLALLADGEVHACRKFPSPLGNIYHQTIQDIYNSTLAQQYRAGSLACASCEIRPVCGGCLASAYSHGLNIFREKDPFCFM
ncbi:MAG: thio(seleno)oxazole modification radical SAM maturase SbtM [Nitrospirota bacterium]